VLASLSQYIARFQYGEKLNKKEEKGGREEDKEKRESKGKDDTIHYIYMWYDDWRGRPAFSTYLAIALTRDVCNLTAINLNAKLVRDCQHFANFQPEHGTGF
jgi:hypothetical protein